MTLTFPHVRNEIFQTFLWAALLVVCSLVLAMYMLGLTDWDLSIPLVYATGDDLWQLTLTKVLRDTGWILTNPYLGAPEVASWHHNAAAQTSALHSVLMLALSPFVQDAVQLQQVYYLINFPLICLTSFVACRLLGIGRLPAFCVGLLFAFTTFRINFLFYAFLSNYFMVPLALVSVIWILTGRFSAFREEPDAVSSRWHHLVRLMRSRDFGLGLVFIVLVAASDGYYAFFTLLLLGFAGFVRAVIGDWKRPLLLLPVGIYIFSLLTVALALALPLHLYKKNHLSEFYPNGVEDPVLIKHPFEAEIYSSSLKLLIAPILNHRIERWGAFGNRVVATSDGARLFKNGRALVPLGTLGSLLLGVALALLAIPSLRKMDRPIITLGREVSDRTFVSPPQEDAGLSLVLFIFLCSISGGIGTLIALVFPTIRAYDRFPLFLIFVLYLGAAFFATRKLRNAGLPGRTAWTALILLVTAAALYDQSPNDARKGSKQIETQFLAERRFVQKVEAALPPNAMVYQYPYSQYLRDSKDYGWGSFSHIRLYLHSQQLRWSNGGAKNSPADDWNFRISQLPLDYLITEVEAAGFSGFVVDRTVVKDAKYEMVRETFASRGYEILEDAPSKLTFIRLRDPGFRLIYDQGYREADRIIVTDLKRLAESELAGLVESEALKRFVNDHASKPNTVIRKADHPELFIDSSVSTRGFGQTPIKPISDMHGHLGCQVEPASSSGGGKETLVLTIANESRFDWKLNDGPFPIRVGVHIHQVGGKILRFDDGFRIPTDAYVRRSANHTIRVPLDSVPVSSELRAQGPLAAEFALVQDGSAWFGNIHCTVPLPRNGA